MLEHCSDIRTFHLTGSRAGNQTSEICSVNYSRRKKKEEEAKGDRNDQFCQLTNHRSPPPGLYWKVPKPEKEEGEPPLGFFFFGRGGRGRDSASSLGPLSPPSHTRPPFFSGPYTAVLASLSRHVYRPLAAGPPVWGGGMGMDGRRWGCRGGSGTVRTAALEGGHAVRHAGRLTRVCVVCVMMEN